MAKESDDEQAGAVHATGRTKHSPLWMLGVMVPLAIAAALELRPLHSMRKALGL